MSAPSDILKGYVFIVFEVSDYKMSLLNDKSIGVQWFISLVDLTTFHLTHPSDDMIAEQRFILTL